MLTVDVTQHNNKASSLCYQAELEAQLGEAGVGYGYKANAFHIDLRLHLRCRLSEITLNMYTAHPLMSCYSKTSMARTSLEPRKYVRDRCSSSQ